jgi:NAD(P)-dependent dehydrogenase (short-subunit alcohol dehydrogenase family)
VPVQQSRVTASDRLVSEDLQLSDHRVVLCGANGTLGRAIARKLADEGSHLALLGRNIDQLSAVVESLPAAASGRRHLVVQCDLEQRESIDAVIETADKALGGIDAFISAAGASQGGIFWELDDAAWQRNLEVKLFGTLRILRTVSARMTQSKRGRIVIVAGNSAEKPDPRMLPGAAANAALLAVVRGLAKELEPLGVAINAVNPGPVHSPRLEALMKAEAERSGVTPEQATTAFLERMGIRELVTPEDVATYVAFFASSLSSHLTGTSITL